MNYSNEQRDKLRLYIHRDLPLGPIDSGAIDDPFVHNILFDRKNRLNDSLNRRPSILIGRRGAGKTAFLKHIAHSGKFAVSIIIKSSEAFSTIVSSVRRMIDDERLLHAEQVSELWDFIFWSALATAVRDKFPEDAAKSILLTKLLNFLGIRLKSSPEQVFRTIVGVICERHKGEGLGTAAEVVMKLACDSDENIEDLKREVWVILAKHKTNAVILFDSLEQYKIQVDSLEQYKIRHEPMAMALSGLLMSVGKFNVVRKRPEIRFCLPAELYEPFRVLSLNKLKDFNQKLVLHWQAGELLSMAAHRYLVYLNLYGDGDAEKTTYLNSLQVSTRDGGLNFFRAILPAEITNRVGIKEDPISYLLRHTQLLPRQILRLLTEVIKKNRQYGNGPTDIKERAIIEGIAEIEGELYDEVCTAFHQRHPFAHQMVREMIPALPLMFSHGELQQCFNRFGNKIAREHMVGFAQVKKMLIAVGCVGVVVGRTEKYIEGIFEYAMPDTLDAGPDSILCLHPLFCGGVKTESMTTTGFERVIYPRGSDPKGDAYLDLD